MAYESVEFHTWSTIGVHGAWLCIGSTARCSGYERAKQGCIAPRCFAHSWTLRRRRQQHSTATLITGESAVSSRLSYYQPCFFKYQTGTLRYPGSHGFSWLLMVSLTWCCVGCGACVPIQRPSTPKYCETLYGHGDAGRESLAELCKDPPRGALAVCSAVCGPAPLPSHGQGDLSDVKAGPGWTRHLLRSTPS